MNFEKSGKILNANLNFAKFEVDTNIPVRFIIYSEKDGLPNEIVNNVDLLFDLKNEIIKDNTATFDLKKYNLALAKGKYFISFQPLTRDFKGMFFISASFFGSSYRRTANQSWSKNPASFAPAININVKMEK